MFTSTHIKHFRGFRDLAIDSFGRINLIIGKNNVGKTALLEALRIQADEFDPRRLAIERRRRYRSHGPVNYEEMWSWSFFNRDVSQPIVLKSKTVDGEIGCTLRLVESHEPVQVELPFDIDEDDDIDSEGSSGSGGIAAELFRVLHADILLEDGTEQHVTARIVPEGRRWRVRVAYGYGQRWPKLRPVVSLDTLRSSIVADARRFSRLERTGRASAVLTPLMRVDPRLARLSVQAVGTYPELFVELGLPELMPLELVGEGFSSLTSILLAISDAAKGVVLIDEIENGLHYSTLVDVWRAVSEASRISQVQVFATTHSWECIQAAHEAFTQEDSYDLAMHRLEQRDGEITVVSYDQETIETSLELSYEMR